MKSRSFWKGFYTVSLILGLILLFLEISIYRLTFIKINIVIVIILLSGFIYFLLVARHYKLVFNIRSNFYPLIQSLLSVGFISAYLFMAANYYFANKFSAEYIFQIKSENSFPGYRIFSPRQPSIKFHYKNYEKEIIFSPSNLEVDKKAESVKIEISKGLFGFDIIRSYKILYK